MSLQSYCTLLFPVIRSSTFALQRQLFAVSSSPYHAPCSGLALELEMKSLSQLSGQFDQEALSSNPDSVEPFVTHHDFAALLFVTFTYKFLV